MLVTYILIFFILIILLVVLVTIYFHLDYKLNQCNANPNFWCYDTWYCPGDPVYGSSGVTGLASSLYGPGSTVAFVCGYEAPTGVTGSTCVCGWSGAVGAGTTYLQQACDIKFVP